MAKKGGSDHNDFNSLPGRAGNARQAINKLSTAFDELSRSGTTTHKGIQAVSGALAAIPHPAAQVASVVTAAAAAFLKASEHAAALQEKAQLHKMALDAAVFTRNMQQAADKWSTFTSAMLSGDSEAVASIKLKIAKQREFFQTFATTAEHVRNGQKLIRELNKELEDQLRKESAVVKVRTTGNPLLAAEAFLLKQKLDYMREMAALEGRPVNVGFEGRVETSEAAASAFSAEAEAATLLGAVGADAFDQYANAMDRVISGHNAFSKSSGRAMQNALANTLHSIGRQAAVEAGMEGARALAAYATSRYDAATNHAAAAAAFLGVAAACGVGAGGLSVKAPRSGGGSGQEGAPRGSGDGRGGPIINLTVIGQLDTQSVKNLGSQLRQEFYEGGG